MEFRIADTFTDSFARLTSDQQKAAKTTAFDLQVNPSHPGLSFHKLDKCRDKNFWSVRVSRDIRLIVHRTEGSLLLCYVDHHDKAYGWAERRRLEVHPKTGAAQLVEIRETDSRRSVFRGSWRRFRRWSRRDGCLTGYRTRISSGLVCPGTGSIPFAGRPRIRSSGSRITFRLRLRKHCWS